MIGYFEVSVDGYVVLHSWFSSVKQAFFRNEIISGIDAIIASHTVLKIDILENKLRKSDSTLARASARLEVLSEIKGLK